MKILLAKSQIYILVFIIISGAIIGGVVWHNRQQQPKVDTTTIPTSPQPGPENPSSKQIPILKLPGAQPININADNYNNDDGLWKIVNKQSSFSNITYQPADLQPVAVPTMPGRGREEKSLRAALMQDLIAMVDAAKKAGVSLRVGSGYRSYATQQALFARYSQQYGEAAASQFSSRAGHSEHQSGLAADFIGTDGACWVDECFEKTAAGEWLAKHAHEYGFILRYPKGKEATTGFQYEPWHFRYVGIELATALHQSGLTLEEAQDYIKKVLNLGDKS